MPLASPMRTFQNVLEVVGCTPLVRLNRVVPDGYEVYAKVESMNPGGSVKDRIGMTMIEGAEKAGLLEPGGTIIEGTSGNTGIGLALVAAIKGYDVIFTMPDKMAVEKERLLRAYGAEVIRCPTNVAPDDERSYYSVAARLNEEIENSFYPNQYFNQDNPRAHVEGTGPEIWQDTDGQLTHFVAGVGTGGTMSGTARYLKDQDEDVVTIGVDPEGSILAEQHAKGE
ncbi:MAG: cysteine synthase family protein, partial [Candidatus Thermoplasmatota archaeon]|nr:cysteine synthase family protein [Candidatus Thermoplasmatota archaeon]